MDYKRTPEFWDEHCHMSGEQLARDFGGDGAHWRRAKRSYLANIEDDPIETPELPFGLLQPPTDGPAILLYDIETTPGLAWVWGQWQQNAIAMERDWHLLSFAYKWMNTDEIGFVSIFQDPDFFPDTTNDRYVAERLAALFDAADVVVAHNGDKFDQRKSNQRFLFWGIEPPTPYKTIDTKKVASANFSHFSNALNELGRIHGLGEKVHHTGFELWRECMRGNAEFWETMETYNRGDITLLEEVFIKLLPWVGLPGSSRGINYGFWSDGKMVCPNCGHDHLTLTNKPHRTLVSEFETYRCDRCKSISRARKRIPQTDGGVQLV